MDLPMKCGREVRVIRPARTERVKDSRSLSAFEHGYKTFRYIQRGFDGLAIASGTARGVRALSSTWRFNVAKKLSIGALSQQSPLRLMEQVMPLCFSCRW